MQNVTLKFNGSEITPNDGITTLGRTSDNDISFPADSNVSRFHAEIENRDGELVLIDLNSSNGTTVNGKKISGETYLNPGDVVALGGTSEVIVEIAASAEDVAPEETSQEPEVPVDLPPIADAVRSVPGAMASTSTGSSRTMFMVAGGAAVVAILVVAVAGAVYYRSFFSSCGASAKIINPDRGETVSKAVEVDVELTGGECVAEVIFNLDDLEVGRTNELPHSITLDPNKHPDLADGIFHLLSVTLVDTDGNRIPQPGIQLALETSKVAEPKEDKDIVIVDDKQKKPVETSEKEISLIDMQEMTNKLVKQFSGNNRYNVSNKEFLQEVRKRTAEYAQPGYSEKASKYRDAIILGFVKEQNLDAPLGYILAMSRSKFDPSKAGAEEGLWRMNNEFVRSNAYDGLCAGAAISEPSQDCAAKAAATYLKALVHGVFAGDPIYSVAAFGRSTADATQWKDSLPKNSVDVWVTIKTAPEREQLVRFFAAGIVAENPQKFGLKNERPLSELFRNVM